jgi:hypothetical protein
MESRPRWTNIERLRRFFPRRFAVHHRRSLITEEQIPLSEAQREQLENEVLNETFRSVPSSPCFTIPGCRLTSVVEHATRELYVERFGRLELTDAHVATMTRQPR